MGTNNVDIVILTVIPQELAAAKTALGIQDIACNRTETKDSQTIYLHGDLFSEFTKKTYKLALGCIGKAGNYDASSAATEVISFYNPKLVVLMGIAAGIKGKSKLGEVIFAEGVLGYESAALRQLEDGTQTSQPRPDILSVPNGVYQDVIFYLATHKDSFSSAHKRLASSFQSKGGNFPTLFNDDKALREIDIINQIEIDICTIASGEKLLKDPLFLISIKDNQHGRVKVGEMEAIGFAKACQRMQRDWLVIRGVSDFGDAYKSDVFQPLASQTAAIVLTDFLQHGLDILCSDPGINELQLPQGGQMVQHSIRHTQLRQSFEDASKGLLRWKSTLINDKSIKRPELDELLNRVKIEKSSTTIVLGVPGSGKSSLMATLGNELVKQGYAILAIKADQLNGAINTIEDLQRNLHLELPPKDAICAIANKEPIVVLIDQLDAVSELLDRKSQRLNLLLSLIQRLSDTPNVHIIATCREFEFRYSSQLAQLANIEQLPLTLPKWEKIAPILEVAKHQPASMGEPLRELLQNPLHLDIFLDVAQPGEVFASSQKLLDCLWEERVTKQPEASKCAAFLKKLADDMTKEEVLWMPNALADKEPEIFQALQKAGLLITNPENSTIGFRHQTYYDHTLARAFACDSQSLIDLVLERQDRLFIRPILLRGLNYLRGISSNQYDLVLRKLLSNSEINNCSLKNKIANFAMNLLKHGAASDLKTKVLGILQALNLISVRIHIYTLLVEFVGSQQQPKPVEIRLLIALLHSETSGLKILDVVVGSPGWFRCLYNHPEFWQWLEKPPEKAVYCVSLLTIATSFAAEEVWNLLEEYWLNDQTYDLLSIRVIGNIGQWTPERIWLIQQIIQRSNIYWDSVSAIAEKIADTLPDQAARVIRAHLDYRLAQAIESGKILPPPLSPEVSKAERSFHTRKYDPLNPLKALLESSHDYHGIEQFAEAHPHSFLEAIWSWFVDIIQQLSSDESPVTVSYRWSQVVGDFTFPRSKIIRSLSTAIIELAQQDKAAFLNFVRQNANSDFLAVHRLLAGGLNVIASEEPIKVLDYLLADPRRFSLGSQMSEPGHQETETLITAIFPCLPEEQREQLEQAIERFQYWQPQRDQEIEFRRRCLTCNREHRLLLLQAIPEELLSSKMKRLKEQEERALPWVQFQKEMGIIRGGFVGPRMTKEEMSRAKDEHLLNLFNELSDETTRDDFRRKWPDDFSRSGGVDQQSSEFAKLVKEEPDRCIRLLPSLEPQRHEHYAGKALEALAETNVPAGDLINILEQLDQQGFSSEAFQSYAAHALQKIAEQHQGLPQSSLSLLERWLSSHSQPELEQYQAGENRASDLKASILFSMGSSHMLPHGRGNIVRAISEGYLKQDPTNLLGWTTFIESQLGVEPHPAVWVDVLEKMPPLLNGDRIQATQLFDRVIRNCPEVLHYPVALYILAHNVGWFEPKETVQSWLEMVKAEHSTFSQQVYGELLLIHYFQYQDEWSVERIRHHLTNQDNEVTLVGLAHTASHLWVQHRCRAIAAEILYSLASSTSEAIQSAVAKIFWQSRDHFQLDQGMRKIIQAMCANENVLLEAANDLMEIVEAEDLVNHSPEVVVNICQSLIATGTALTDLKRSSALAADSLTRLAIQLHRQQTYREVGLQIFEQLLALNVREARAALEVLDRRPDRAITYVSPRRRLRSRRGNRL